MSKHLLLFPRLAPLFAAAAFLTAETAHVTPFTGAWTMNPAKSHFNPPTPFKSFTMTFTPDGVRHLDLLTADDQSVKVELPWSDGKEVPVSGMENAVATSKLQGRKFNDTWRQNGKLIETVHGVVSSDGRTVTITIDGTDAQNRAFHNRLTFEKQ